MHVYQTGTEIDIVPPQPYSTIASLSITGRVDVNDELTLDLTGGNPTPAGGISFDGGVGGSNALLLVADTGDNGATMTATQITNNGVVLANYINVAHFGFSLGSGTDSLLLDHVTLNLDRDNAISDGTNVTVSGGVLNFGGYATVLGDLVVSDDVQVQGTNLQNATTTVASGTVTVGSIVTGTLTVGPTGPITIPPDRYEDNDTKAIVDSRPEGGVNSPNLGLVNSQQIITGLTMEDSADWYKFRTDAASISTDVVRIDFANSQGNLDMVVYAADGTTVVGSSTGTGDSEVVNLGACRRELTT